MNRIKNIITYISGLHEEKRIKELANYSINNKYKRIYFYHIRKAAGKSVTDIIMSLEGKDHYKRYGDLYNSINHRIIYNDKVFVGWHPILIQKGHYYYAYSHIPYHQIKIPSDTFTFTCLRDPVNRVISYYLMLQRLKARNDISKSLKIETNILGETFNDFINNIPKKHLLNQLYMFSKEYSVSEAVDRISNLSHYFFVENFSDGIKSLGEKLNLKLEVLHTDKAVERDSIDSILEERLQTLIEPEYEMIRELKTNLVS